MLCPKCKTAARVKRVNDKVILVCRNKACPDFGKEVKDSKKDSK